MNVAPPFAMAGIGILVLGIPIGVIGGLIVVVVVNLLGMRKSHGDNG